MNKNKYSNVNMIGALSMLISLCLYFIKMYVFGWELIPGSMVEYSVDIICSLLFGFGFGLVISANLFESIDN